MAPPSEEPNQPPKRETAPGILPTVGLGKDQVRIVRFQQFGCMHYSRVVDNNYADVFPVGHCSMT